TWSFAWKTEAEPVLILPRRDSPLDAAGEALDSQKALGVGLVVGAAAFHGGDAFVVEVVAAGAAGNLDVAFVEIELHFAGDGLLGFADEGKKGVEFGGVPEAVIDAL